MIRNIKIEKFWDQYQIDWAPHPDVNILVGINGSGKSTLLRIIAYALSCPQNLSIDLYKKFFFADGYRLQITGEGIDIDVKGGSGGHAQNTCNYDFVNTFDEIVHEKKALDQELSPLTAYLYAVIFNTRAMSLNSYRLKATENPATGFRISERLQQWMAIVNDFFATTNKSFEIQGSDVFFKQADGKKITLEQLSSGEKQLLIILTNALTQDQEPFVLLMDEPEISLDIDWQYKLINTIRLLNPKCQLFIATHSPSIFGDGWNDKLIFMEELLQKA